jgi:hypothetical protein
MLVLVLCVCLALCTLYSALGDVDIGIDGGGGGGGGGGCGGGGGASEQAAALAAVAAEAAVTAVAVAAVAAEAAFAAWFEQNGGYIQGLELADFGHMGRGFAATRSLKEKEKVLQIPHHLIFR